mmetsp:Transcript_3524/g.4795  ORF Transcript_3524/g.4795 Transcript_3524/m.4795 type:complete len:80 (-) Transcript_3524:173-412(-)
MTSPAENAVPSLTDHFNMLPDSMVGDKDGIPTISWLGYEVKVRRSWCVRVRVRVVARNSIMVFSVIVNFGNWKTLSDFL